MIEKIRKKALNRNMVTSSSETTDRNKPTDTEAENQDINTYEQQLSKCEEDIFRDP